MEYLNKLKLLSHDSYVSTSFYTDQYGMVDLESLAEDELASESIKLTNEYLKEIKLSVKVKDEWYNIVEFTGLKFTVTNGTKTRYYTTTDFARLEAEFKKE